MCAQGGAGVDAADQHARGHMARVAKCGFAGHLG